MTLARGARALIFVSLATLAACAPETPSLAECRLSSRHSTLTAPLADAAIINRATALAREMQHTPLADNCCTAFRVDTAIGQLPEALASFEPAQDIKRRAREVGLTSYTIVRVVATDSSDEQQTLWFHFDRCGNQL